MSTLYTAVTTDKPPFNDLIEKIGITLGSLGLLVMLIAWAGVNLPHTGLWFYSSIALMSSGILIYSIRKYMTQPAGIKNHGNFLSGAVNRGAVGWAAGILISGFYVVLYLKPIWLGLGADGAANSGLVGLFDPFSMFFRGRPASQWFVYGTLYTFAIIMFGIKFILKYRHNKYQILRTISVMFFQLFLAYLIPEILEILNPETATTNYFSKDLKNMWPLNYDFFADYNMTGMTKSGFLGYFFLFFGLAMVFLVSPVLTYLYGKRWYCSWVCGCGGLAETAGDPYRHLSNKSESAWKVERWVIHSVLLFSFVMTIAIIYGYLGNDPEKFLLTRSGFTMITILLLLLLGGGYLFLQSKTDEDRDEKIKYIVFGTIIAVAMILAINWLAGSSNAFFLNNYTFRSIYGLYIGAIFSGIIGVGFYPLLGNRVWCRFGCPMAAVLGLQQKLLSRFRITTNGSQCISCGNCSTYCEMGIDVRAYAQKGQSIVRASCVGCGVCSAVCPRGVLKLENGSIDIFSKTSEKRVAMIPESEVGIL